jgi:hypothetical protein
MHNFSSLIRVRRSSVGVRVIGDLLSGTISPHLVISPPLTDGVLNRRDFVKPIRNNEV